MAWQQLDCNLKRHPKTLAIVVATGMTVKDVVATLADFWGWVNDLIPEPLIKGVTPAILAEVFDAPESFFVAMCPEWLVIRPDGIEIPEFDHRFSQSAKRRAQRARDAARQAAYRARKKSTSESENVTRDITRDTPVTRHAPSRDEARDVRAQEQEEEKEKEKHTTTPPEPRTSPPADVVAVDFVKAFYLELSGEGPLFEQDVTTSDCEWARQILAEFGPQRAMAMIPRVVVDLKLRCVDPARFAASIKYGSWDRVMASERKKRIGELAAERKESERRADEEEANRRRELVERYRQAWEDLDGEEKERRISALPGGQSSIPAARKLLVGPAIERLAMELQTRGTQ